MNFHIYHEIFIAYILCTISQTKFRSSSSVVTMTENYNRSVHFSARRSRISVLEYHSRIERFSSGFQIASERHPRPQRLATVREHWRCDRDARTVGDTGNRNRTTSSLGRPELFQRAGIRQRISTSAYSQKQGNQLSNVCKLYSFASSFLFGNTQKLLALSISVIHNTDA